MDDDPQQTATIEHDLQSYNSAFVQANTDDNPALMIPWMRPPVLRFGIGTVTTAATPQDIEAMYRRMIDGLKGTGYARSTLSNFDITLLNPTTALVRCHAVRERADATVVEEFDACYLMARGDTHWQVAALISQRPA